MSARALVRLWLFVCLSACGGGNGGYGANGITTTAPVVIANAGPPVNVQNDLDAFFDGQNSFATLGIAEWIWDFGDGREPKRGANLPQVHYTYPCELKPPNSRERTFTVTLTIVDRAATRNSATTTAVVSFIYAVKRNPLCNP